MNLFGNFYNLQNSPGSPQPPKKGIGLYLQVFWDNLGKLLIINMICFGGFLPAALLISLGVVYGSFWLTIAGGVIGGAAAAPFWTASLYLSFFCFRGVPYRWFAFWKQAFRDRWKTSAGWGALIGCIFSALLLVWSFCKELMEQGVLPALPVWVILIFDYFIVALAASLLFSAICFDDEPKQALKRAASILFRSPVRLLCAALGLLAWCALFLSLFPVSVPFAAVVGFWPVLLLLAQLQGPVLAQVYPVDELFAASEDAAEPGPEALTRSQRTEIWWRRFWAPALGVLAAVSLGLGFVQVMLNVQEPDMQVAVIHADALPDSVKSTLEKSLSAQIGDLNGDGTAFVQVNDYALRFDGSEQNKDMQAAGVTQLTADLSGKYSVLLIVEDAEGFLSWYGDQVDSGSSRLWKDCPALSSLDAGTYSQVIDIEAEHTGQELLAEYTVFPSMECPDYAAALMR